MELKSFCQSPLNQDPTSSAKNSIDRAMKVFHSAPTSIDSNSSLLNLMFEEVLPEVLPAVNDTVTNISDEEQEEMPEEEEDDDHGDPNNDMIIEMHSSSSISPSPSLSISSTVIPATTEGYRYSPLMKDTGIASINFMLNHRDVLSAAVRRLRYGYKTTSGTTSNESFHGAIVQKFGKKMSRMMMRHVQNFLDLYVYQWNERDPKYKVINDIKFLFIKDLYIYISLSVCVGNILVICW